MGVLTGVKVVDLTRYVSGPLGTMMLGDLGADVIKVEPPLGDPSRQSGPFVDSGESVYYMASNRNKRSVVLDLRTGPGMELLHALIDDADVFVENFRPGTAEQMGLGAESLRARNPRLVYASISGFGNTDAGSELPGFDQTVQGMSGLMSVTGTEETGPLRCGIAVADSCTGVMVAFGIVAALFERERTGKGGVVEASLMQSMMTLINYQAQIALSLGVQPPRVGNDHPIMFPQGTFTTADGSITIACGNDKMWGLLCGALGTEALAKDPRFVSNELRMQHRRELRALIETALESQSSERWVAAINRAGVPCGPVLDLPQALDHPTTQALGLVQEITHPTIGAMRVLGKGIRVNDDDPRIDCHPPLLGEHTIEVLSALGLDREEVERLLVARVASATTGETKGGRT